MKWIRLESIDQLAEVKEKSNDGPVLIFKHSTRCSISSMALSRLESEVGSVKSEGNGDDQYVGYYLDLIRFRDISNQIANDFSISHASPQVLVIKEEKATFDTSHFEIRWDSILGALESS